MFGMHGGFTLRGRERFTGSRDRAFTAPPDFHDSNTGMNRIRT